jgi:flagellar protein FliS
MFGFNSYGVNEYTRVGIETGVVAADPHKLIVMLYEGAIAASQSALIHMQNNAIEDKGIALSKAIMIIENGLRISLDKKVGGEIAASLDSLYEYMSNRLYMANLKNQPELVREVIQLLTELKTAWAEIANPPAPVSISANAIQELAVSGKINGLSMARG